MKNDSHKSTRMKQRKKYILLLICYFLPLAAILYHCLVNDFSADRFLEYRDQLRLLVDANQLLFALLFFATYMAIVVSSVSFNVVMNLFAGYLFGAAAGGLLAAAAVTCGSYILFLLSRSIAGKIRGDDLRLGILNGDPKNTAFMLIFLRLSPFFPSPVINMGCGAFGVKGPLFVWTTLLGSLPLIMVYTLIGGHLDLINQINDIYDRDLMIMLISLSLFSLAPLLKRDIRNMPRMKPEQKRS